MKQYEMVFCDKGTKYEKEVIRVFIPFEKDGTPIENPDSSNCRRVIVGTRKEFNAGLSRYKTDAEKLRIIEKRVLKKRQEIIIGIERGNVASRKNRKKKQALMQDLFNAFILDYQSKNSMVTNQPPSASSVKTMKDHWKKYILIYGNHNCGKFPDDFEERWIKDPKLELAIRSKISYGASINQFLSWCYKNARISEPRQILLPRKSKQDFQVKAFTEEQKDLIEKRILEKFETANQNHQSRLYPLTWYRAFFLFRYRGLRAGDQFRLKLEDIRMDLNRIILKDVDETSISRYGKKVKIKGNTKSRAIESVPITPAIREFLEADLKNRQAEEVWWLDRGTGNNVYSSATALSNAFSKILKDLGLKGTAKPTHGFRSALGTQLMKINPVLAQQALRHTDIRTTQASYYVESDAPLMDQMELLETSVQSKPLTLERKEGQK